jgi:predicted transcriptional regulator
MRAACRRLFLAMVLLAAGVAACTESGPEQPAPYLIRAGGETVSVVEYKKALELARSAYPVSALQDPETDRAIRIRVLRELTEELVLRQRARELGLSVAEEEIDRAEERIRSDFPENEFEQAMLESAVSYPAWKGKLASRLLAEKLIREDLENQIRISARDVSTYYRKHRGELTEGLEDDGAATQTLDERIVEELRRKKLEEAYTDWIEALRERYPVDINIAQWERIGGFWTR